MGRRLPDRHDTRDFKIFHYHDGMLNSNSDTFVTCFLASSAVMYVPFTERPNLRTVACIPSTINLAASYIYESVEVSD